MQLQINEAPTHHPLRAPHVIIVNQPVPMKAPLWGYLVSKGFVVLPDAECFIAHHGGKPAGQRGSEPAKALLIVCVVPSHSLLVLMVWMGLWVTQGVSHTDLREQQPHPHSVMGIVRVAPTRPGAAGRRQSLRAREQVFSVLCCLYTEFI